MAQLVGPLKIIGTIDGLSFSERQNGKIVVQRKPGPTSEQVKTDENFELTRRYASEFGKVTQDAMLLRHCLGYLKRALCHSELNSHVIKRMQPISLSDTESCLGSRHVNKGNLQLLEGFDFNHQLSLERVLPVRLEHSMDLATGRLQLQVPGCTVRRKKVFPEGATHFKIVSCAAALDFDKHRYTNSISESELLPLSKQTPAVTLEHSIAGEPGQAMVHTVGIIFYKVTEGKAQMLKGGVMRVVEVARVAEVVQMPELPAVAVVTDVEAVAAPALTMTMPTLAIEQLNASHEAGEFTVGITDAMGVPLQDEEVRQAIIAPPIKKPRKRTRLKKYCGGVNGGNTALHD